MDAGVRLQTKPYTLQVRCAILVYTRPPPIRFAHNKEAGAKDERLRTKVARLIISTKNVSTLFVAVGPISFRFPFRFRLL